MYYFEFCKDKPAKKISWAASISSESKQDLEIMAPILKKRLKNFDYISVRERESADFVQTLTDKPVFHEIDLVLMLEKEDYSELLLDLTTEPDSYIYTYLFDKVEGFEEILKEIDYENVYEIIDEWRDSTMKFLNDV